MVPIQRHRQSSRLRKDIAIEHSILDGFFDVMGFDTFGLLEIGDGAGDADDFIVGSGGESQFGDCGAHALGLDGTEGAVLPQFATAHLGVGQGLGVGEALALEFPGGGDLLADLGAAGPWRPVGEFFEGDGGDFDVDIDTIEERAADSGHVAFDLRWGAIAATARVGAVAAWAGIEGGHEHEAGGEGRAAHGARDGDDPILEGLSHDFERFSIELGKFIEEENAVVGEGDFAWSGRAATPDESCIADGVVG